MDEYTGKDDDDDFSNGEWVLQTADGREHRFSGMSVNPFQKLPRLGDRWDGSVLISCQFDSR